MKKPHCLVCGKETEQLVPLTNTCHLQVLGMDHELVLHICFDCLIPRLDLPKLKQQRLELAERGIFKSQCPVLRLNTGKMAKFWMKPEFHIMNIKQTIKDAKFRAAGHMPGIIRDETDVPEKNILEEILRPRLESGHEETQAERTHREIKQIDKGKP